MSHVAGLLDHAATLNFKTRLEVIRHPLGMSDSPSGYQLPKSEFNSTSTCRLRSKLTTTRESVSHIVQFDRLIHVVPQELARKEDLLSLLPPPISREV